MKIYKVRIVCNTERVSIRTTVIMAISLETATLYAIRFLIADNEWLLDVIEQKEQ